VHQAIPFLNRKLKPCIKNTAVKSQNAGCPALSKCLSLRHLELHAYCPPVTCSSEPEVQLCPTHPTAAPTVHAPIRQHQNPPCRPPSWSPITHAGWKKSSAQQLSLGGQTSSTSQPLRAKRAWLPGCLAACTCTCTLLNGNHAAAMPRFSAQVSASIASAL
jgi:hypothetical protein